MDDMKEWHSWAEVSSTRDMIAQAKKLDRDYVDRVSVERLEWLLDKLAASLTAHASAEYVKRETARADRAVLELDKLQATANAKFAALVIEASVLRGALEALVSMLDVVHEDSRYKSVWTMFMIHGGNYTGPTYEQELIAAKEALKK